MNLGLLRSKTVAALLFSLWAAVVTGAFLYHSLGYFFDQMARRGIL